MRKKLFSAATIVATSLLMTACGGGDGGTPAPAASTLGGTAAVGAPIVGGAVSVSCASGSAMSTTTGNTGAWQVTTAGQTLPCAVQVSGGTVAGSPNSTAYHSIAINFGTLNITPLTDLVIANLAGKSPSAWFTGLTGASLQSTQSAALSTALENVKTALGLTTALKGANPLTASFQATKGNVIDDILEAMAAAWKKAGLTYAELLAQAYKSNFVTPPGFDFSNAYITVTAGGTGSGSGTGPAAGTPGSLQILVSVSGVSSPAISISDIPKPKSQSEFCDSLANDSNLQGIGASGGGSLTINSCSFSGSTGKINATLNITTPIALSLPYVITYNYQ